MVEKMMYDQRQKEVGILSTFETSSVCVCVFPQMGLPTSEDQKKQDVLKK